MQRSIVQSEMVTKPLRFSGNGLELNVNTATGGSVRVEISSPDGSPIEGYRLSDCDPVVGDDIEYTVSWNGSSDVGELTDRPIRLRFVLQEADLYALRFAP